MDIKRLLQEKQILCKVKADTDRDSLLDMMAETLAQGNVLADKDAYLKAVMKREADMSTQTNGGIALPHACNSSVKKLGISIATIADEGVDFSDDADCKCKLLFMIAIPADTPAAHIPLYAFLADFLTNSGKLDEVLNADSPDEIIAMLTQWQEKTKQ
ncbi:MAG: PTS sugar transporter subunit IIA [Victivallales bacterium]|nr:PTS sugar transporter subunit IIA [Victivallales bacterium]